jgi:hypothetical protein
VLHLFRFKAEVLTSTFADYPGLVVVGSSRPASAKGKRLQPFGVAAYAGVQVRCEACPVPVKAVPVSNHGDG